MTNEIDELRNRVADLEQLLNGARARINNLEEQLIWIAGKVSVVPDFSINRGNTEPRTD